MDGIDSLKAKYLAAVASAADEAGLEEVRVGALGKKGEISALMATLGKMEPEVRKAAGAGLNALKDEIDAALRARKTALCAAETAGGWVTGFGIGGAEDAGALPDFAWSFDCAREAGLGELAPRMRAIPHPHLVLLGALDRIIPLADMKQMAAEMPACRLVLVPGVGQSMNLEDPALFAGYVGAWLGGLG